MSAISTILARKSRALGVTFFFLFFLLLLLLQEFSQILIFDTFSLESSLLLVQDYNHNILLLTRKSRALGITFSCSELQESLFKKKFLSKHFVKVQYFFRIFATFSSRTPLSIFTKLEVPLPLTPFLVLCWVSLSNLGKIRIFFDDV